MTFKLGLSALVLLTLLFPEVQSGRAPLFHHRPFSHSSHHKRSAASHASHVTRNAAAPKNIEGNYNIQMVTMTLEEGRASKQQLAGMLDSPVSGPNPSGNSESLASILDTPVSGPNPGGNSASLATVLDTPVSGPNPEGNAQNLAATSGPNPGGNAQNLAASSGPNPGGNSDILMVKKTAEISVDHKAYAPKLAASSGPNPGGNSQSLAASSGPNPGGNSDILIVKKTAENSVDHKAYTPKLEASSGPNPGGNAQILTASSRPNPGGNSDILTVEKAVAFSVDIEDHKHERKAKPEKSQLAEVLDTPVSGPNPSGNSEILISSSGPNTRASGESLASILDTPVSGPNPSGNSANLAGILDTPVSGPNPGGNSEILASVLDTPVSGPNPGGNDQELAASSGPNRAGDPGNVFMTNKAGRGSAKHTSKEKVDFSVLDTPVSGPSPAGNSEILFSSSGLAISRTATSISNVLTAVSGPNPSGNSASLASSDHVSPSDTQSLAAVGSEILAASSGPNPGGNAHIWDERKTYRTGEQKVAATAQTLGSQAIKRRAEQGTLFSELPRAPVPPSGPSPNQNAVITSEDIVKTSVIKRSAQEEQTTIGCNYEQKIMSNMFQPIQDHASENAFPHNTIGSMGIATRLLETKLRR